MTVVTLPIDLPFENELIDKHTVSRKNSSL